MNKKLIAAAVAGAFVAPAAFAQNSTVQIYGLLNAEYGVAYSQPNYGTNANPGAVASGTSRSNTDAFNSGASRIGFRGEEKLAGGLAAFWQCESDVRFLGGGSTAAGSLCDRNSAIGLKGGFGSFYVGNWDSPLKRATGMTRMTNETGWLGTQQMTIGNAGAFSTSFSTRNLNSINYDTPNFNGFSASAQFTANNRGRNSNVSPTPEGREVSLSLQYAKGPLTGIVGYTRRDDAAAFQGNKQLSSTTTTTYTAGSKDEAWAIGAMYNFGPVTAALTYADAEYDNNNTAGLQTLSRKSWNLAADWRLGGPHTVRFGYARAGDTKCSGGTCPTTTGADTGAKQWQIGYHHALSKRTTASASYVRMDNDRNGIYTLTGSNVGSTGVGGQTAIQPGSDSSAFVLGLTHTF